MADRPRPIPRELEVTGTRPVSRNMLRLTLGGEGLAGFPADQAGGYVKLMLAPAPGSEKPTVRTYTIRDQRPDGIDIDFALHGVSGGEAGPATDWAMAAEPGQRITVGGPGPAKPLPPDADWYVIAGDMTALPAIGVNLERLARDAKGVAVIEIQHEDDRQAIDCPPGIELHWLVNPQPGERQVLADHVRSLGWREGDVYAWAACEFSSMRELRAYLREERGLGRDRLYISSYWKCGLAEDSHKTVKREDAIAVGDA